MNLDTILFLMFISPLLIYILAEIIAEIVCDEERDKKKLEKLTQKRINKRKKKKRKLLKKEELRKARLPNLELSDNIYQTCKSNDKNNKIDEEDFIKIF